MLDNFINPLKRIGFRFCYDSKLKYKLIFSFSIIVLLSVLFVGLTSNYISKKYMLDEEKKSLTQSMLQLNNTIEYFFEIYMNKSEMIFNNAELQKALTKRNENIVDIVETHAKINEIIRQLTDDIKYPLMKNSYYLGGTLKVVIYTMNDTLPSDGEEIMPYEDVKNEDWCKELFHSNKLFSWESNVSDRNGHRYITMNRRLFDFEKSRDIGVLRVYIPVERIKNVILNNVDNDSYLLFYSDEDFKEITQSGGELFSSYIKLEDIRKLNLNLLVNDVRFNKKSFIIGYLNSDINGWKLVYVIPTQLITEKAVSISVITVITALLAILICIMIALVISEFITRRIDILVNKTDQIKDNNMSIKTIISGNDEIGQLDKNFNSMVYRINDLIENEYKWKISVNKIQVELLQEQINPHMLYNSLAMIGMLSRRTNNFEISETADNLINFYKGILNKGRIESNVKAEIDMIMRYIDIMKMVYSLEIETILEIEPDIADLYTIKLFLQPIVENSILHGIKPIKSGIILVSGKRHGDSLEFCVSDNGIGMPRDMIENIRFMIKSGNAKMGYGISNVSKRITLFFGDKYGVDIKDTPGGGTTVIITVPALSKEDMNKLVDLSSVFS